MVTTLELHGSRILIGAGLLDACSAELRGALPGRRLAIISDDTVAPLYAERVHRACAPADATLLDDSGWRSEQDACDLGSAHGRPSRLRVRPRFRNHRARRRRGRRHRRLRRSDIHARRPIRTNADLAPRDDRRRDRRQNRRRHARGEKSGRRVSSPRAGDRRPERAVDASAHPRPQRTRGSDQARGHREPRGLRLDRGEPRGARSRRRAIERARRPARAGTTSKSRRRSSHATNARAARARR